MLLLIFDISTLANIKTNTDIFSLASIDIKKKYWLHFYLMYY